MSLSRRQVLTGILGSSAALVLAGCSAPSTPAASGSAGTPANYNPNELTGALARIKSSGTIRIGMEGVYTPYGYHQGDQLVGIEKEIGDFIAQQLGVKASYVETKWDSLIAGLDVNKYDIVLNNIAITDARKQKYDFSIPYLRSIGKAGVRKGSSITSIDQIKGKRAAQTPTSNWGQQAKSLGAEIVPADGFVQTVELVASGRADVTLNDFVSFQQYLKQHTDAPITLLDGEVEANIQIAALLNKGNEDLKAAVDAAITKGLADGTISSVTKKYTDTDLTPQR